MANADGVRWDEVLVLGKACGRDMFRKPHMLPMSVGPDEGAILEIAPSMLGGDVDGFANALTASEIACDVPGYPTIPGPRRRWTGPGILRSDQVCGAILPGMRAT